MSVIFNVIAQSALGLDTETKTGYDFTIIKHCGQTTW